MKPHGAKRASGSSRHPLAGRRGVRTRQDETTGPVERALRHSLQEIEHAKRCARALALLGAEAAHHARAFADQREQWAAIERVANTRAGVALEVLRDAGVDPGPTPTLQWPPLKPALGVLHEVADLTALGLVCDDRTVWLAGSEQADCAAAVRDCAERMMSALHWLERTISASSNPGMALRLRRVGQWRSQWHRLGLDYRWDPKRTHAGRSIGEQIETLHAWGVLHALGLYDCAGAIVPAARTPVGRGRQRAIRWTLVTLDGRAEILGSPTNQVDRYLAVGRFLVHTTRHWRAHGGRAFRFTYHSPAVDANNEDTRRQVWIRVGARTSRGESGVDLELQTGEGGAVCVASVNAELQWK
jgi:hypothetical protein